ncbi:Fe(3+) ABC transporter substrate-binding protein [Halofilum ochraceum]|uniref:Fe(3+) ABC transporter substrate-binding protein n=1 Tax=Halofilum ochraceum TaxID=1611323 RepID=UPI000833284C|nr:Fe(3+) ABC transporter substrate-binding protein [Halofilum ochraceum]
MINRWLVGLAAAAVALPAAAESVNVYSARHYDTDDRLYEMFTEQTGIEVNVLEGDSDELIQRIKREGDASPADIMMTVDAGRLWRAEDEGIFQPIESDVLDERIPDRVSHPDGLWYGFSQRLRLVFYNKENFDPDDLETYEDLADDRFKGQICIRSSSNIYNQSLLASLIAEHGQVDAKEWAQGLVDNLARSPQGGDTDQIRGAAAGECELAVANHYYYLRLLNSDDPEDREVAEQVGVIFPNQDGRGAHANIGGAGVVDGAPNREAAIKLLEFLASDEAQRLFAEGNNEYPVVADAPLPETLQGWHQDIVLDDVNVSALGRNNPTAVRIMDEVGWR